MKAVAKVSLGVVFGLALGQVMSSLYTKKVKSDVEIELEKYNRERSLIERENALNAKEERLKAREDLYISNDLGIPSEYCKEVEKYIDWYESVVESDGYDKFVLYDYDGVNANTNNTQDRVEKLFASVNIARFRNVLKQLNPYDVKSYFEGNRTK